MTVLCKKCATFFDVEGNNIADVSLIQRDGYEARTVACKNGHKLPYYFKFKKSKLVNPEKIS